VSVELNDILVLKLFHDLGLSHNPKPSLLSHESSIHGYHNFFKGQIFIRLLSLVTDQPNLAESSLTQHVDKVVIVKRDLLARLF
jgi:hypothetical protein